MKVLSGCNVPLPFWTAGGIFWVNGGWHLAEAGATVHLLAGMSPTSEADEILAFYGLTSHPRLSITSTKPWPITLLNRSSALQARAYLLELVRRIRAIRPDVLYCIGMPNHLWVLRILKKVVPFKVILELHQYHSTEFWRQSSVRLMEGTTPQIDGIVTVSRSHRDLLIEEGAPHHRVHTYYSAQRPDLVPSEDRHELLEQLQLPIDPDSLIVLYGGNLYGDRGVDDLIRAFRQVVQHVPTAQLIVLGKGEPGLEKQYRALAENGGLGEKIHFTGHVHPTVVGRYLAVADVGAVPCPPRQQWEHSSPNKLSEYLGAGLAVVATDLQNIADLVGPEEAALLVRPEAPQEMAEAIIRLLTDEPLRRSMQEKARRLGRKLTYQARAESVYQFFKQLTDGHELVRP